MKRSAKRGFTLMEMLIVTAVIAVLIAIAIPTFSNYLEKSREAVDLANVRGAYAELMHAVMLEDETAKYSGNGYPIYKKEINQYSISVDLVQKQKDWQMSTDNLSVAGIQYGDNSSTETIWEGTPGKTCVLRYTPASVSGVACTSLNWSGVSADAQTRWNNNGNGTVTHKTDGNYDGYKVSGVSQLLTIPVSKPGDTWELVTSGFGESLSRDFIFTYGVYELGKPAEGKDDQTYICYRDSGEMNFVNSGSVSDSIGGTRGTLYNTTAEKPDNVNVAIQLFKKDKNGTTVQLTDKETSLILSHMTIVNKNDGVTQSYQLSDFLK